MRIVFRTDASFEIGTGHVMRCLTLADRLIFKGAEVFFICCEHFGNLIRLIEAKGYLVFKLPYKGVLENQNKNIYRGWLGTTWEDDASQVNKYLIFLGEIDWLIVDHYAIEAAKNRTVGINIIQGSGFGWRSFLTCGWLRKKSLNILPMIMLMRCFC